MAADQERRKNPVAVAKDAKGKENSFFAARLCVGGLSFLAKFGLLLARCVVFSKVESN
jgi:hypothetical protein